MPVSISGDGVVTGLASLDSPTTVNGLTIPTTGFGKVLQVVVGTTSTVVASSTTTYADTGLTATITPTLLTSRVLALIYHTHCIKTSDHVNNSMSIRLLRNGTQISQVAEGFAFTGTALGLRFNVSSSFLDSPNSISSLIYKTTFANYVAQASVSVQIDSIASTIVLMEVAA